MPYKSIEKQREFQRLKVRKERENFFGDKCCVNCGSRDRLQLDHIDRTKKVSHNIWSWRKERRDEEISKCQVLCYDPCHKEKTRLERISDRKHGLTLYTHGCRCDICFKAQQKHNARRMLY